MSQHPAPNPFLAACLTLAMSAFVAGTLVVAKMLGQGVLGPEMHPFQISFGRFAFAFLTLLAASAILRPKIEHPNLRLHFARSATGWLGVSLMFAATSMIPLSDASAISFLNPVFCMILAIPFLGERVGKYRWFAAAMAILGAVILLRPSLASIQLGGLVALAAAFLLGIELIFIKLISRGEPPLQILLINNGIGLAIASLAVSFVWVAPSPQQWAALAVIGVLMVSAQACFINAMKRADASFLAPITYTTLVFAAFYDFILFHQRPDMVSLIGGACIISGALLLAWREGLQAK